MGPIIYLETLLTNCQSTLRKIPEDGGSNPEGCGPRLFVINLVVILSPCCESAARKLENWTKWSITPSLQVRDFQNDVVEESLLVGSDAALQGKLFLVFWRMMFISSVSGLDTKRDVNPYPANVENMVSS